MGIPLGIALYVLLQHCRKCQYRLTSRFFDTDDRGRLLLPDTRSPALLGGLRAAVAMFSGLSLASAAVSSICSATAWNKCGPGTFESFDAQRRMS